MRGALQAVAYVFSVDGSCASPLPFLRMVRASSAHVSEFMAGVAYGMHVAGSALRDIATEVKKNDGTSPTHQGVQGIINRAVKTAKNKRSSQKLSVKRDGRGAPRVTTKAQDKKIVNMVFKHRGRAYVTVAFIKKALPEIRQIADRTLASRLVEAGLAWMRRRRKTLVPAAHKDARVKWVRFVLNRREGTLSRWVYSDGTVFYLARSATEQESAVRSSLGPMLWKAADGHDALFEDCVGPSSYSKAQGQPVRVWGLLANGRLFITVLPEGQVMNRWWYAWVVDKKFPGWCEEAFGEATRPFLVQDHERALWATEAREAMSSRGISLLENYPKSSQDLNPIETCWRELRQRLASTQPIKRESRAAFIVRLRAAVAWVNKNRSDYLLYLCGTQKEYAREILAAKPPGARLKH